MTKNQKIIAGVVAAVVVVGLVIAFANKSRLAGSISPAGNPSVNYSYLETSDVLQSDGMFAVGGAVNSNSAITQKVVTGTCATASSTLFAVANPFNASSTVFVQSIQGTGQATSSTLQVGTSTTATGLITSTVSSTLINGTGTAIATTSPFYFSSGITVGSLGVNSAGAGSYIMIEVGPSDYVSGFSTSTGVGSAALNYSAGQNCNYKISFQR